MNMQRKEQSVEQLHKTIRRLRAENQQLHQQLDATQLPIGAVCCFFPFISSLLYFFHRKPTQQQQLPVGQSEKRVFIFLTFQKFTWTSLGSAAKNSRTRTS